MRAKLAPLLLLLTAGCSHPHSGTAGVARGPASARVQLVDVTDAAGIRFHHTNGSSGRLYFPETMGAGCAFLDYDGDGWQDIFLVNSAPLPGFTGKGPFYPALYRNRGDGTFVDVTRAAGLAFECYGIGCAVGDYDNDGDDDLYVTAWGANHLFRNDRVPGGRARFTDVTARAGVGEPIGRPPPRFSTSAAWLDYDRDGDLDLFVCNYCEWKPEINRTCRTGYGAHVCGPKYYPGDLSNLYRNEGDGTFTRVTEDAGLLRPKGKALGVAVCDLDDDRWPDLVVAHDGEPNSLYLNRGRVGPQDPRRRFVDTAVEQGIAYGADGKSRAGMGIDTSSPLGQGPEVIAIGNNPDEGMAFFRPAAGGHYSDDAYAVGVYEPSLSFLTFGLLFADYDLDGFPDLLAANGHVDSQVEIGGGEGTFAQRLLIFHNEAAYPPGTLRFAEVGTTLGAALATRRVWRGLAWADFDNDGDPDFLVTACNGRPMLLRNDLLSTDHVASSSPSPRRGGGQGGEVHPPHWLKVQIIGTRSNRSGLGSRVTIEAGGRRQTAWVRSGSSYGSASEEHALFGLGEERRVDRVRVRWASGGEEEVRGVEADRLLVIREGQGRIR